MKIIIAHQSPFHMLRTPLILTVPLMLAGVAFAQKVQTDYDRSIDFSKFHTYAWREHPILRNNPQIGEVFSVALDLVRSEINGDLTSKNYTRAESKPDFWVTLYVDAQVSDEVDGTLVIDMIDGSDDQLAWRSFCKITVKDAEDRHKPIEKAVRKAMKKFPPNA